MSDGERRRGLTKSPHVGYSKNFVRLGNPKVRVVLPWTGSAEVRLSRKDKDVDFLCTQSINATVVEYNLGRIFFI